MILIESGERPYFAVARLQVGVEFFAVFEVLLDREQHLGGPRRKRAAGLRLAGLHDHRLALRRARHHQRPAHLEVLALVMEHVQLFRVEEQTRLLVQDEGVVLEGVPQALRHLDELGGALVAVVMRRMRWWLKFNASDAADEVTTFQPTRPSLNWSSVANIRATWNGSR